MLKISKNRTFYEENGPTMPKKRIALKELNSKKK